MADAALDGKRSWRSPPRGGLVGRSRYVWRWILSFLAIGLIAIAVYWAWPRPDARTLLLVLGDDREERNILPPVPYVAADTVALQTWAQAARVPSLSLALSKIETPAWLARQLSDKAVNSQIKFRVSPSSSVLAPKKDDTLVIYIKGHGLALDVSSAERSTTGEASRDKVDARPILIKSLSENDLSGPWYRDDAYVLDVRQLLQELAALPDLRKLVIFDSVHLNYDPRLGTLINAFPTAVKQAVEQLPSRANLWVLVGQGDGELAVGVPGAARSALVDSLVGSLEQKRGDGGSISLAALQDRVGVRLAALNQDGPGSFLQKLQESFPPVGKGLANSLTLPMSPPPPASDKAATPATSGADVAKAVANSAPVQAATAPVQQAAANANATAASVTGSAPPSAAQPAPSKDAAAPPAPATPSASGPNGQVAGQPAATNPPAPTAGTPPAASAPPPPGPPPSDLQLAWESRDRLRAAFKSGWSPAHVGPQLWRRIESVLAGFDERRLSGDQNQKDSVALAAFRDDLSQLEATFAGRAGTFETPDCRQLAATFTAFKSSPAFRSFQARQQSGLETANDALKVFAETAYRARDYVYLHGQTIAVLDGGPFTNAAALENLLSKLQDLRGRLDPTNLPDARLTETRGRELARLLGEVDQARDQVEKQLEDYARSVVAAPDSPGKLLRVRLLLHSPAVSSPLRTELRKRVETKLGEPPGAATSPPLGERLATNANLVSKLLTVVIPAAQTANPKPSAAAIARWSKSLGTASAKADAAVWLDLGRASREFADALTTTVKLETGTRGARQDSTPLDSWELFKTALLLDGRDTARLSDGTVFSSWIAQPLRPEQVPDKVVLEVPPNAVQLGSADQDPTLVTLGVRIQSEKPPPYSVALDLRWNRDEIDVASGDGSTTIRNGKNDLVLESEKSELLLRIRTVRKATEAATVSIRTQATFSTAQSAPADLRCLLPRPDQIDLTIAADDNLSEAKGRTWKPSTSEGGRLNLFANRERTLGLYLTNLSSENKKLIARLYRVPLAATSPGGRLLDPKAGYSLLPNAVTLDTRLKQPNTDITSQLRTQLIAQTTDKDPFFSLPVGSEPVKIPLIAVPAAPPAAVPAAGTANSSQPAAKSDDATGGLLLVVHNADGKSKPYFKWIELQMLQPDDLLAIKEPLYRDGRLSFRVELKDQKLIEEMGVGKDSVKLNWETRPLPPEVPEPPKDVELIASNPQGATFSAVVPPTARWPLLLQFNVDRDPRALVTSLEKRGESPLATNLKENHLPSVHIWRAGVSPSRNGMPPERFQYLYRPKFPWLAYPAVALVAEGVSEAEAGKPIFVRIDPKAPTTRLDLSLGADVAPRYFTDGARLRVSTEGLSQEFATERQVSFRATVIEGGLLQVQCEAGDFNKIEFGPIDVPQDKRLTFTAEVDGNFRSIGVPEDSHDSVTFVLDRTPPRILELTADKLPPAGVPVPGVPMPTKIQIRCRADDGEGSGIAKLEFIPGFDQNNNRKLDPMEQQPPIPAIKQPDGYYEAQYTIPGELPNKLLLIVEAIATDNVQYTSDPPGHCELELTKPQPGGQRTTFGGKKIDDPTEKDAKKNAPPKK